MPAILTQGETAIRDSLKTLVTHVAVSDDTTAFSAAHTGINPGVAAFSSHLETSTESDVGTDGFDAVGTITGTSEFTGKTIFSIGVGKGTGCRVTGGTGTHTGGMTVGTDLLTRTVRSLGIGVIAGDVFTIGCRIVVDDNS